MATINLIGVPFPKDAPLFASDRNLQKKLFKLESLIEMHHDIHEIESYIAIARNIQEDVLQTNEELFIPTVFAMRSPLLPLYFTQNYSLHLKAEPNSLKETYLH